jgi:CRP-like cAMP-binding protein
MADGDQLFARFGKVCPPGTVLFREGETGKTMYVLQSGRVRITKKGIGTEPVKLLAELGPGEFFGEMAILNDKPRNATAEVIEEARLLTIDARTFEQMVVGNTEIAVRLIKKLARRLDSANALIEVLMQRDPKARVILGLSREASSVGRKRQDGSIAVPLDTEALASQIGLSEAEVAQTCRRLARLGILEMSDDGLVIKDVDRLHEFLEFLQMQEKFGDA